MASRYRSMGEPFDSSPAGSVALEENLEALLYRWHEYHIVYHTDLGRLLVRLMKPLLSCLVRKRAIDRFFLVRYTLGGPHLRVRWRVIDEQSSYLAEEILTQMSTDFFQACPSLQSASQDKILEMNRRLGALDPSDDINAVYCDNAWLHVPLRLDVERYGGKRNITESLDLFTISTLRVMELLSEADGARPAWLFTIGLTTLLQLAFGFARDEDELLHHMEFAVRWMGADYPGCVRQGDTVFAMKAGQLQSLVRRKLQSLIHITAHNTTGLAPAAACLRAKLEALSPDARSVVACSHLHMTANRLGLSNQEEVYLSRLLYRTVENLRHREPEIWRQLWRTNSELSQMAGHTSLESLANSVVSRLL